MTALMLQMLCSANHASKMIELMKQVLELEANELKDAKHL